jgi:hypothetical protein
MNPRNRLSAYFSDREEINTGHLPRQAEEHDPAYCGADVQVTGGDSVFLVRPLRACSRDRIRSALERAAKG